MVLGSNEGFSLKLIIDTYIYIHTKKFWTHKDILLDCHFQFQSSFIYMLPVTNTIVSRPSAWPPNKQQWHVIGVFVSMILTQKWPWSQLFVKHTSTSCSMWPFPFLMTGISDNTHRMSEERGSARGLSSCFQWWHLNTNLTVFSAN